MILILHSIVSDYFTELSQVDSGIVTVTMIDDVHLFCLKFSMRFKTIMFFHIAVMIA